MRPGFWSGRSSLFFSKTNASSSSSSIVGSASLHRQICDIFFSFRSQTTFSLKCCCSESKCLECAVGEVRINCCCVGSMRLYHYVLDASYGEIRMCNIWLLLGGIEFCARNLFATRNS